MSYSDYVQAAKIGKKDYQSKLMAGESPTLEVLDDILHTTKSYREVSLGLVQIPLAQVPKLPEEAILFPATLCLFSTLIPSLLPSG